MRLFTAISLRLMPIARREKRQVCRPSRSPQPAGQGSQPRAVPVPRAWSEGASGRRLDQMAARKDLAGSASVGTKGVVPRSPVGRCGETLDSAPFRRLAELASFGDTGMRDFATLNSTDRGVPRSRSMHLFAAKLSCKLLGGSTRAEGDR